MVVCGVCMAGPASAAAAALVAAAARGDARAAEAALHASEAFVSQPGGNAPLAAALHAAAVARAPDVVILLLRACERAGCARAAVGALNATGRTPLEAAMRAHNLAKGYARPAGDAMDQEGGVGSQRAEHALRETTAALLAAGARASRFPPSDGVLDALPGRLSDAEESSEEEGSSGSNDSPRAERGRRRRRRRAARGGRGGSAAFMYTSWDEADALAARLNATRRRRAAAGGGAGAGGGAPGAELQAFVQSALAEAASSSDSESDSGSGSGSDRRMAGSEGSSKVRVAECDGCSRRRWQPGDVYFSASAAASAARLCEHCAREELAGG